MSAIWGTLSYNNNLNNNVGTIMQAPYHKQCKIDSYQSRQFYNCYMGCGIQYITNEAVNEQLPIVDYERNLILTTDCILDNRLELMDALSIHDVNIPDGRLVYIAYLKWGIDCVKHFRGLFTLAVWEENTKTLYLANDQVSARCLYYYPCKDQVSFSTLITPILELHPEITLNEMYCMDYLAAPSLIPTVVVPETPYKGVYKLPQATILTITQQQITQRSYWTPAETLKDCTCKTAEEYGAYFRKLLTNCVSDAIHTNQEVGIALSSGLDSSSVGTIAAELLATQSKSLYAYTYVPYEKVAKNNRHKIYDETQDVKAIVAMHPNILPHFLCNEGKNAMESIPDGLQTLEIPYKAFVNYPNLNEIYDKATKADCRVVLSGQFGNSTISYGNIDPIFYDLYCNRKYHSLFKCLTHFAEHMNIPKKKFIPSYLMYLHKIRKQHKVTTHEQNYELLHPFLSESFKKVYPLKERFDQGNMYAFSGLPNTQAQYRQQLIQLMGCTYMGEWETKIGLKHGIVLRDPTKDIRILSFCYHMPYEYFAYQGTTKWLIRENMKDMLPSYILENWDRHGIQNDDWAIRITRDWNMLSKSYIDTIDTPAMLTYLDIEQILSFVNSENFSFKALDINTQVYLSTAYILSFFINNYQ